MIRGGEDTYLELKVRFSNVEKLIAEIIALANTDGGAIVFGVNDQLRIEGVDDAESIEEELRDICLRQIQPPVFPYLNKVAFDNGRRIVLLEVDTGNRPHRTLDDRFYLRDGSSKRETSREELSRLYHETHLHRFEQTPVFQAQCEEDIDESLFWSYVRGVNSGFWGDSTKGFPTDSVLLDMGLALKFGDEVIPSIAGLLLFGWNERMEKLAPHANVQLTRFSGNDHNAPVVERVQVHGNLLRLFDGSLHFLNRYIDLCDARPSRKLQNDQGEFLQCRPSYHRGAILEALANFFAHRDWSAHESQARINIYDSSVELINPSRQIELPIISLRYGVALPPNPRLKAILTNQHYGLPCAGGGVPMICQESTNFARRAPEGPAIANGEFRLKIHGLL